MITQFREAYNNFAAATNYTRPLSFEEWVNKPSEQKAVLLFVQFYDQINLAKYKADASFVSDDDELSCVLQYLNKNVSKIEDTPSKFNEKYIYRVAYNCMDCLRYIQRDKERAARETSSTIDYEGDTLSLYDLVSNDTDFLHQIEVEDLWNTIEGMDISVHKVIDHILNGTSLKKSRVRSANRAKDPYADVEVTPEDEEEIMEYLRYRLEKFKDLIA